MTEARIVHVATIFVSQWLAQNGMLNKDEAEQADWMILHPLFCAGKAGFVHKAYHKARSKMRRQAQAQRGRLSRPQLRRWKEVETDFKWLYALNALWLPAIERNGVDCLGGCGKGWECYYAQFYDRWVNYPN